MPGIDFVIFDLDFLTTHDEEICQQDGDGFHMLKVID
jgi:hypothetical protein